MRTHLGATTLLVCASLLAVPAARPAAAADATVTATCVDGNHWDGVDTRSAAKYCSDALNALGFTAQKLTNTDATSVVQRIPTDRVFAHAGHAYVTCESGSDTICTAVASAMAGSSPTSTAVTALLGDASGATYQGPITVCNNYGCHDAVLAMTPYNTEMTGFELAVFASCNSGRNGAYGYASLVKSATDAGVDNVIGFKQKIYWIADTPNANLAGDAFLRTFWKDLRSGATYDAALADAATAAGGYGFNSYVHNREAGTPNRPIPSVAPASDDASSLATLPSTDWKDRLFADVANQGEAVRHEWVEENLRGTTVLKAQGPEGIVSVDPASGELLSAVREEGLVATAHRPSDEELEATATSFLEAFGRDGLEMVLASTNRIDHGSWSEARYTFRDQTGSGFGPNVASVSVNESSGVVASYAANWVEGARSRPAAIAQAGAVDLAARAAGFDEFVVDGVSLDWQTSSAPAYVWTVRLSKPIEPGAVQLLETASVELEAANGKVLEIARG